MLFRMIEILYYLSMGLICFLQIQQQLFCEKSLETMLTIDREQPPMFQEKERSQNSQTSESSVKNKPVKRMKEIKRVSKLEIEELNDRVKNQFLKNKKNYDKLLSMSPYFSMKLYTPNNNFTTEDCHTSSMDLMMKQLELLLDDGHALEKQIMKTSLRKSQNQSKDNHYLDQWRHHYSYLRKIWSNPNEQEANKPLDLIEQLNKKVVIIKNNIHTMMDMEKKCHDGRNGQDHHDQYELVTRKINEVTHEVGEYTLLKQKYQNLRMAYEDIQEKYHRMTLEMDQKMFDKNEILQKIKGQNEELKKVVKEYKEKLFNSEVKETNLLGKIKELEVSHQEKKEVRPSLENSLSHSILKTSQLFSFDKIRFTKMENRQLLLNKTEDEKSHNRNKHNLTISVFETHDKQEPEVKPFEVTPNNEESQENINCMNGQRESRLDLSTARSMEKKGRFARMRSPCHGKLLKTREEETNQGRKSDFISPRLKEMKERRGQEVVTSQS